MIADYPDTLVGLQIHTSGGGPTSPWGSSRISFYGVSGIPHTWVDGVLDQLGSMGSDPANYNNMVALMNQRLNEPTDVLMQLYAMPVSGQTYSISAVVGIAADGVGKTMNLHLVQALYGYPASSDGRYNNGVMQGFGPIQVTLAPGQTEVIVQEITFDNTSWGHQDDIRLAGFLQEVGSAAPAEVYQADVIAWPFTVLDPCPADVNGDATVDVLDLLAVLAAWGQAGVPEDINGDGLVDVLDLLELLAVWGPCAGVSTGACCLWDGTCADLTYFDCVMTAPGVWHEGEECATFTCDPWPTGACCDILDCVGTYTEYECAQIGGTWFEGEDCSAFTCYLVYCDSTSTNCNNEYISRVHIGTIDNYTDCGFYQDFTNLSTDLTIGVTADLTLHIPSYQSGDIMTVWVDWNQDGDFDDPDETFAFGDPGIPIGYGEITPPAGATLGETRMRVTVQYQGPPDPCATFPAGEVEDYTINVVE